jgi:hypothetical protein
MDAQKELFAFELDAFYRLERTKRPSTFIAVYAELLASMTIQNSSTINCEVRFRNTNLKLATRTVTCNVTSAVKVISAGETGPPSFSA